MTDSFYCPCGFASNDGTAIDTHIRSRIPLHADSCCSCGGQKCMSCVVRYMHDDCVNDCPDCCEVAS